MASSKNLAFNSVALLMFFFINMQWAAGQEKKAQQPSIMIFPSDNLLKTLNCLRVVDKGGGDTAYIRDYQKAFINSSDLGFVISAIQQRFDERGFPLKDLEQNLKSIQQRDFDDKVNGYDRDSRSELLLRAKPDVILEINYNMEKKGMACELFITLRALDAYTLKSFANAQNPGIESINCNVKNTLAKQTELNVNNLQSLIESHFEDIRQNGREITINVRIENDALNDFRKDKCGTSNYPYNRWIYDWIRENSMGNSGTRTANNPKELFFEDVRVPLFNKKGIPISASDWADLLVDALMENCDIIAVNNTQGLGEAIIVVSN